MPQGTGAWRTGLAMNLVLNRKSGVGNRARWEQAKRIDREKKNAGAWSRFLGVAGERGHSPAEAESPSIRVEPPQ